jgi:hypothetical protein
MINSVAVSDGENHDDDWLEFRFGDPDPAISLFSSANDTPARDYC